MSTPASESPFPSGSELASAEFSAIYAEHSRAIYYLALRMLGDPHQAEDATHDVFLRAFRKMDQFRKQATVRTWLYRIAINHCKNISQSWHERSVQATNDEALWNGLPDRGDSPLRVLEIKELGWRIQSALNGLPGEYRLLLLLVADENLSYEEIGSVVGQSPDAVRGKLHRARKAFASLFEKTSEKSKP